VIEWVATHRKHHRFSDQAGDPHSQHVDHAPGWRGALRGLGHAHVGGMLRGNDMANPARIAKDLLVDRDLRFVSRTFPLWVLIGLALPFGVVIALTGTVDGGSRDCCGAGRCACSSCTTRRSVSTRCATASVGDHSRPAISPANLAWLAPLAFGEAWHHNHHRFPTSARHGLSRWQLDPGAWRITTLERCHVGWDVISPRRQPAKRGAAA
jgi:stearoyl-CoA desaturase (Delta-9 desaturase)